MGPSVKIFLHFWHRTYAHTMDSSKDCLAVASILLHTLNAIKAQLSRSTQVSLRSNDYLHHWYDRQIFNATWPFLFLNQLFCFYMDIYCYQLHCCVRYVRLLQCSRITLSRQPRWMVFSIGRDDHPYLRTRSRKRFFWNIIIITKKITYIVVKVIRLLCQLC